MPIDRFLAIAAATLNFFGAVFVFVGTFHLIKSDLSTRLAITPSGGFTLDRLRSLSREKGYTVSGLIVIAVALLFQTLQLIVIQEAGEVLSGHDRIALALALCLGILPVFLVFRRNLLMCRRTEQQAKRAAMRDRLARLLNQSPIRRAQWNSVVEDAQTLLGVAARPKNEPIDVFLRKLARDLEVSFPVGLQIEDEQARSATPNPVRAVR